MKKIFTIACLLLVVQLQAQDQHYKVTLMRANPGDLLALIDLIKEDIANHERYFPDKPWLLRHSQGDQWDLMLIYPIGAPEEYFSPSGIESRSGSATLEQPYGSGYFDLVSFQEEAIVKGPEKADFIQWFETYGLYHIEIFTALAGKQTELLKQRQTENEFLRNIDRRPNFIFTRVFGPSWDIFTIGVYEDMHDFAGPQISFEEEDEAAKKAGFEGVNYIGSYLRSLIREHHDTLAKKIN